MGRMSLELLASELSWIPSAVGGSSTVMSSTDIGQSDAMSPWLIWPSDIVDEDTLMMSASGGARVSSVMLGEPPEVYDDAERDGSQAAHEHQQELALHPPQNPVRGFIGRLHGTSPSPEACPGHLHCPRFVMIIIEI